MKAKILTYYKIEIEYDANCYSLVNKTKKGVIEDYRERILEGASPSHYGEVIQKIQVYFYGSGLLDLLFDEKYREGGVYEEVVKEYAVPKI